MVKSNNFAHRNRRERENYLTMVAIAVGGKNVFMRKQCLNPIDCTVGKFGWMQKLWLNPIILPTLQCWKRSPEC